MAIAIVSVIAGIRDYGVGGPDVLVYGNRIFSAMLATPDISGIGDYAASHNASGEVGYYFLNWFVSRYTDDPHIFYTLLAGINATSILIAALLLRKYGSVVVMWLTYLLTVYVEGFNLLRQGPALSLTVLSVALVLRGKYRWGFLVGATGFLFHNSAIMFFPVWIIAFYLQTRNRRIFRSVLLVLLVGGIGLAIAGPALEFLSGSLQGSKYEDYLSDNARGGRAFGVDALYRLLPILAGLFVIRGVSSSGVGKSSVSCTPEFRRHEIVGARGHGVNSDGSVAVPSLGDSRKKAIIVLVALLGFELLLLPIRAISYPFYRLLSYFGYLRILAYGVIPGGISRYRTVGNMLSVAFAATYFGLIVLGRNDGYYSSEILEGWLESW